MTRILLITVTCVGALALVASTPVFADDEEPHGPPPSGDPRFEFLKSLEGTWVGPTLSEGMPEGVFEFRITAGGHAVEEREMIGTPMEMVTLYHMDGEDLVATHYCMLGNRPHLTAAEQVVDDTLSFSCAGTPGGATSHDDEHVHAWSIGRRSDGTLEYLAELVEDGEVTKSPSVVLTRRARRASR